MDHSQILRIMALGSNKYIVVADTYYVSDTSPSNFMVMVLEDNSGKLNLSNPLNCLLKILDIRYGSYNPTNYTDTCSHTIAASEIDAAFNELAERYA